MKTGVIYARYSSDSQTEQSIEGQLRVCNEYAKSHDILILDTYIDRAMTGTNDNRPEFQRMIKDSHKKSWDMVLVYKLDRFSRDKYATTIHKKTLKDNGIKLVSATEFIPDTPEGIILESLLEGMNQYYSAELSQKIKRGKNESRHKGLLSGGVVLYGYKNIDKKAVVDNEQATVIISIYEKYCNGWTVLQIMNDLNSKGISHNGKPFRYNTLCKILKNEKYIGIYRYKDQVFDNIYPKIVPQSLFDKANEISKKNSLGRNSTATEFLLRQKVKCGLCGAKINGESGTASNGEKKYYYKCRNRKHHKTCNCRPIPKDILENYVADTIVDALNQPNIIDKIADTIIDIQKSKLDNNHILQTLKRELSQIELAISNLISAIEQGVVSDNTSKRLHELEEKQILIQRQILIEDNKQVVLLSKEEIKQYYLPMLKSNKQALINYLLKEVIVSNNEIQIIFNTPLKTSPDQDGRGYCIYSTHKNLSYKTKFRQKPKTFEFFIKIVI